MTQKPLKAKKARKIARFVLKKPRPANGTQYRNRVVQAAHKYELPETKIHSALCTNYNETMRTEWYPEQVTAS